MRKYYKFECQLGTQFACIDKDGTGQIQTGWGWRPIEDEQEREKILKKYKEITVEEFENIISYK